MHRALAVEDSSLFHHLLNQLVMTVREQIKQAIEGNAPFGIVYKDNGKSLIVEAAQYSYHSAVLDNAFRVAEDNGIKWKCIKLYPWTIKFS